MFAFVDESHRRRPDGTGTYFFGVVLVAPERAAEVRTTLVKSLPKGLHRFHFSTDREEYRRVALKALAAVEVEGYVVFRADAPAKKSERARSKAMWVLLADIVERGVTEVFFENRTKSLNARDHRTIANIRGAMPATRSIRYEFVLPSEEALCWLPDVLAGAVGHDLHHGTHHYRDLVPEHLQRIVGA